MRLSRSWRGPGGRVKPSPPALLAYGLTVTVLAFYADDPRTQAIIVALTGVPGLVAGFIRYRLLVVLIPFAVAGAFLNAMLLYYLGVVEEPGEVIASIGPLKVPEYAVRVTATIGARIVSFAGAGLLIASFISPRDAVKSLSDEMSMPKGLSFSLAFALRLLPLLRSDMEDILLVRKLRGHRRVPLTPGDYRSIVTPLLAVSLERALWVAVASELRGFSLRKGRGFRPRLSLLDIPLALALALQLLAATLWG